MILDAGVLVSVDRRDRAANQLIEATNQGDIDLHTSEAVVAQVWRDGARQARLAAFLQTIEVHPLDDGRAVGRLLKETGTSDVVDAHLGLLARDLDDEILTGDVEDLRQVVAAFRQPVGVLPWPPP